MKKAGRGLLDSAREVLRHVRRDPVLPGVLSAYAALLFCGPSVALMAPLFRARFSARIPCDWVCYLRPPAAAP